VDSRAGASNVEKWKFLALPGLELQPLASRYTDSRCRGRNIVEPNRVRELMVAAIAEKSDTLRR
jgi:hypothetical protein